MENQNNERSERRNIRSVERSGLSGTKKLRQDPNRRMQRPANDANRRSPRRRMSMRSPRKKNQTKKIVFILILLIGVTIGLLTTTFSSAKITLTVASADISIDGVFDAVREPLRTADISYTQSRKHEKELEEEITSVTREQENSRATGTVTVYNTNPSGAQLDLVNRTRFQTEDGRIYRMIGKQTIPGGKIVAGEFQPGSKEVRVEADEIGLSYNLTEPKNRFSIPGLAKFQPFADSYAISNTTIVGGFSGEKLIPDPEEESKVRTQLRERLERELKSALQETLDTNTLSERIVFDDGIFIKFESLEDIQNTETGSVTIREKASLRAILFREKDLAALLSKYAPDNTLNSQVPESIQPAKLSLEIESRDEIDIFSEEDSNELRFRLRGDATIFWGLDEYLFRGDILGKKRGEVEDSIFKIYPQVVQVNSITIFPAWRTNMPKNRNKIELELLYEN